MHNDRIATENQAGTRESKNYYTYLYIAAIAAAKESNRITKIIITHVRNRKVT